MQCIYCKDRDATPLCVTCQRCRGYMHRWGKERDQSRVVRHFNSRALHLRLLGAVSVVVGDNEVRFIDEQELINARVMRASRMKRKATAVVVSIKQAQALRKRYVEPALDVVPVPPITQAKRSQQA